MAEILQNFKKNYDPNVGAQKIDLGQLNIEYSKDTEEITKIVSQLEHGLDKYLNGELVFGDKGVGMLPQQSKTISN